MMGWLKRFTLCTGLLQLVSAPAWARGPSEWLRVDALPGVRLAVEHGAQGSENVRLRVGQTEHVFRVETLPSGTALYYWGDQEGPSGAAAAAVPPVAPSAGASAVEALGGVYTSLHPWDSVTYGRVQWAIELAAPARLLVAAEAPMEPEEDPLAEVLNLAQTGSRLAWSELFHSAGLSGVYIGNVPAHSTAPGFRWVALDDAALLSRACRVSPDSLLRSMREGAWARIRTKALPVPLLQLMAVARLEEQGLAAQVVRAALPAELSWFNRALDAPQALSPGQRAALWAAVPETPEAWHAWGFTKQRALCTLPQGAELMDLPADSLCRQFLTRMCAPEDLF